MRLGKVVIGISDCVIFVWACTEYGEVMLLGEVDDKACFVAVLQRVAIYHVSQLCRNTSRFAMSRKDQETLDHVSTVLGKISLGMCTPTFRNSLEGLLYPSLAR